MKAIITDLDRTLLRTDRTISAYTCAVLKRCRDRGEDAFSNKPIPEWNDSAFDGFPALPTESAIYKILLSREGESIQPEVERALTPDTYMTMAEWKLIQIMGAAATKWNGIQAMLKAVGIHSREAVYFVDDYDDIESIKNCGMGVAVSNAIEEVLAIADSVAESNDMDGVARYIEENCL